mmetsp:Transcript_27486/g.67855  ORF Transcript_27486/g.67855 Transcript_27486/m.67855 type:complete len:123 (-) Transcript_27486:276-644(-)
MGDELVGYRYVVKRQVVTCSSTPSDRRTMANTLADLRRTGFEVVLVLPGEPDGDMEGELLYAHELARKAQRDHAKAMAVLKRTQEEHDRAAFELDRAAFELVSAESQLDQVSYDTFTALERP